MAGIDKTYTDSYEDYKEFKTWANTQVLTFFNGHEERIGDYVWNLEEEDFGGEIPIMNTPTWLDAYLIQHCNIGFVIDRMKSVYSEDTYNELASVDLTSRPPEDYKQNRKIRIKPYRHTKFPLHSKPYADKYGWSLYSEDGYWYNDETKTWASHQSYYPTNTNTASLPSIKAIARHLRKQYLPKGASFRISGRYIGEQYLITVS